MLLLFFRDWSGLCRRLPLPALERVQERVTAKARVTSSSSKLTFLISCVYAMIGAGKGDGKTGGVDTWKEWQSWKGGKDWGKDWNKDWSKKRKKDWHGY